MKKVCLIGYGKWGQKIYKKTNKIFDYKYVLRKKNFLKKKYLYNVDWVIVASPNKTHFKIVKKCLLNKKNVFCEKPLALNLKDTKILYKLAMKNKVDLVVSDFSDYKKNIPFLKKNFFKRTKFSPLDRNKKYKRDDLLFRFAYHDFGLIYNLVKNQKIISIKIHECVKNLFFSITFKNISFTFLYDTNVKKKLYLINNKSLYQKEDIIKKMYKDLITNKKKFKSNKLKSLFIIKMIEKIKNKIL